MSAPNLSYVEMFDNLASRSIIILRPLPIFMPDNVVSSSGCVILTDYLQQVQPSIDRQLMWCQTDTLYHFGLPLYEFEKVYAVVNCTLQLLGTLLQNVSQHRRLYLLDYRSLRSLHVRVHASLTSLWQEVQLHCTMRNVPSASFQILVSHHSSIVKAMNLFITKHLVHIGATRCLTANGQ